MKAENNICHCTLLFIQQSKIPSSLDNTPCWTMNVNVATFVLKSACKVSTVQWVVGEVDWGQVHPPPAPVMTPPSQHRVQTSWPNYIACLYLPLILPTQAINKYILQDQPSLTRAGGLCNTKPTHRFHASKSKLRFLFWSKTLININIPS